MTDNKQVQVGNVKDKSSTFQMISWNVLEIVRKLVQLPQLIVICLTIALVSGKLTSADATKISTDAINILSQDVWGFIGWVLFGASGIYGAILQFKTIPYLRGRIAKLKKGKDDSEDEEYTLLNESN